jgi:hypothetical protein
MSAAVRGAAAGSRTARIAASRFDLPAFASPTSAQSGPGERATSRALLKPLTLSRVTPKLARPGAGFTGGGACTSFSLLVLGPDDEHGRARLVGDSLTHAPERFQPAQPAVSDDDEVG